MVVKLALLRDLESLLQWLESNNEVTWWYAIYLCWYRSLLCTNGSLLIEYTFASSQGYLILHQIFSHLLHNQYTCMFAHYILIHIHTVLHLNSQLDLFIYTLQICQFGYIKNTLTNNHYINQLQSLHRTIKINSLKQWNPSLANPTR